MSSCPTPPGFCSRAPRPPSAGGRRSLPGACSAKRRWHHPGRRGSGEVNSKPWLSCFMACSCWEAASLEDRKKLCNLLHEQYAKFSIYYIYYNSIWCDAMSEVVGYAQRASSRFDGNAWLLECVMFPFKLILVWQSPALRPNHNPLKTIQ